MPGTGAVCVIGANAVANLQALAGTAENLRVSVLRDLAAAVVYGTGPLGEPIGGTIRDRWPVGLKQHLHSIDLWYYDVTEAGAFIGNTAGYAKWVWSNLKEGPIPDYWLVCIEGALDDMWAATDQALTKRVLGLIDGGAP